MFNVLRNYQTVFQDGYIILLPTSIKGLLANPSLEIVHLLHYNHSSECEIVSYGLNLHFPVINVTNDFSLFAIHT
jgi:hypothetical protein